MTLPAVRRCIILGLARQADEPVALVNTFSSPKYL